MPKLQRLVRSGAGFITAVFLLGVCDVAPAQRTSVAVGSVFKDCDVCPEMVAIPAGSFMMGSPESEPGRDSNEGPQHQVMISRAFAAGKYEVTFDEWDACVRESGCIPQQSDSGWLSLICMLLGLDCIPQQSDSGWGRGRRPVINVSWYDAKQYVAWLSRKTGKSYRLLSEAEWEYVARAGTTSAFNTGASISPTQANYNAAISYAGSPTGVSQVKTVPVGSYAPNAFGLHDVHGNVWEWVEDCWNLTYLGAPTDGSAWTPGNCAQFRGPRRVLRGGSWGNDPRHLRSARRIYFNPTSWQPSFGFRVARTN